MNHTDIPILPYNLPDIQFFRSCTASEDAFVYVPTFRAIVLGRGSEATLAFHPETVVADHIPVYKRPSGGETVILSPETLVLAVVRNGVKLSSPHRFFKHFSGIIIDTLTRHGVTGLAQRGISDISVGPQKVLGSSIYWQREKLLYHAVLNVNEPPQNMARYLKHPPREPDYRKGRGHLDFVTTLRTVGCTASIHVLSTDLENALRRA